MSIVGNMTAAFTRALKPMLHKSCQRQVPTLTTSGETWANSGSAFVCGYAESSPIVQGQLDYNAGAGYGEDVWVLPDQSINAGDRIVAVDRTFKVLMAPPAGSTAGLRRLRCERLT